MEMYRSKDLTGKRFGYLIPLYPTKRRANNKSLYWRCYCDYDNCGSECEVLASSLLRGGTVRCPKHKGTSLNDAKKDYLNQYGVVPQNLKQAKRSTNKSGYKGVSVIKDKSGNDQFRAEINFKGQSLRGPRRNNVEEAYQDRLDFEDKYFAPILEEFEKKQDEQSITVTTLAKLRGAAGLTQNDLSKLIGVNKITIQKIESTEHVQNTLLNTLLKLSDLFNVSVEELTKTTTIEKKQNYSSFRQIPLNIIMEIRNAKGMSQQELADKIGMATSYIGLLEFHGKQKCPRYLTAKKIATGLGFKVNDIFFMVDNALPEEQIKKILWHRSKNLIERQK